MPQRQSYTGHSTGPGYYARPGRPVLYAYGQAGRQGPRAARPQGYGPGRGPEGRPPYDGGEQRPPHLGAWLQRHGNMSLDQQERALRNEPGFKRLPPQTQHQLADRLRQLDGMPPAQRQRTLNRIEALERLSPEMRQQVQGSIALMRTLPAGRQRMVKKAFRDLRNYPPAQRETMMAAPQFQAQFTPQERGILSGLLAVEPYEPNEGFRPEYSPPPGK